MTPPTNTEVGTPLRIPEQKLSILLRRNQASTSSTGVPADGCTLRCLSVSWHSGVDIRPPRLDSAVYAYCCDSGIGDCLGRAQRSHPGQAVYIDRSGFQPSQNSSRIVQHPTERNMHGAVEAVNSPLIFLAYIEKVKRGPARGTSFQ